MIKFILGLLVGSTIAIIYFGGRKDEEWNIITTTISEL